MSMEISKMKTGNDVTYMVLFDLEVRVMYKKFLDLDMKDNVKICIRR